MNYFIYTSHHFTPQGNCLNWKNYCNDHSSLSRWRYLVRSGLPVMSRIKNCFFNITYAEQILYGPSLFGQDGWILASFFWRVYAYSGTQKRTWPIVSHLYLMLCQQSIFVK